MMTVMMVLVNECGFPMSACVEAGGAVSTRSATLTFGGRNLTRAWCSGHGVEGGSIGSVSTSGGDGWSGGGGGNN